MISDWLKAIFLQLGIEKQITVENRIRNSRSNTRPNFVSTVSFRYSILLCVFYNMHVYSRLCFWKRKKKQKFLLLYFGHFSCNPFPR